MEQEYIKNPLIGQITNEGYDTFLKLNEKLQNRVEHLYHLLGLGCSETEIVSYTEFEDTIARITVYDYYAEEYLENEYEIPAQYLYMNDNEVLADVRKKKEEKESREKQKREQEEQRLKEEAEKRAKTIQEAENKKILSIKESLSTINSNLTQEELTKLAENLYYEIIDN